MTTAELAAVEAEVNARVRQNSEVATRLMTPEAAVEQGALALFGEKYGEEVRVVSMGATTVQASRSSCAAARTCAAPATSAPSRSSGEQRLSRRGAPHRGGDRRGGPRPCRARGGDPCRGRSSAQGSARRAAAARRQPAWRSASGCERELSETRRKLAAGGGEGAPAAKEVGGVKFASRLLDDVPARELKAMADALKKQVGSGVVAIAAQDEGKASLVVGVTDDLTGRMSAVDFVRLGAEKLGGKGGGGRPDMAQAGGPDVSARQAALDAIEAALARRA